MKKDILRAEVVSAVKALGFTPKRYKWVGCDLHIVVAGEFRTLRFPAGMTKKALAFELGRLSGWCEILAEMRDAKPRAVIPDRFDANGKPLQAMALNGAAT